MTIRRTDFLLCFPPARWLADYRAAWLRGNLAAGVALAAYAIPVSLAYAELAGGSKARHLLSCPIDRTRLATDSASQYFPASYSLTTFLWSAPGGIAALNPIRTDGGLHPGRTPFGMRRWIAASHPDVNQAPQRANTERSASQPVALR